MAHAERVGVGKGQAELAAHLAMVLDDAVEFAADVLGRRLHARQEPQDGFLQGRVQHGDLQARSNRDAAAGAMVHHWLLCGGERVLSTRVGIANCGMV